VVEQSLVKRNNKPKTIKNIPNPIPFFIIQ
jgi:hypothetical protein